uniref:stage V sporulation protein AA n=1 Tax=Agathobacter sp. TaxID=2021311 RepID=UPI004055B645
MPQQTIYIKAAEDCVVYDKKVVLGDILKLECTNIGMLRAVKQMDFYSFNHEHAIAFSILKVIERIHRDYPNVHVVNCGEEDFVVEYKKSTVKNSVWEKAKLVLVCVLVFFGSAFTIMTFHNDIGIEEVFERFYLQLMGNEKPMITELEVSYSIGLGTGIILFFNHISKKKISHDPTPIEVELKKYNKDLIMTKIADMDEKGHKEDVT